MSFAEFTHLFALWSFRIFLVFRSFFRTRQQFICSLNFIFWDYRFIVSGRWFPPWIAGFLFCTYHIFFLEPKILFGQLFMNLPFEGLKFIVWGFKWCHFCLKGVVAWHRGWFECLRILFKDLRKVFGIWFGINFTRGGPSGFLWDGGVIFGEDYCRGRVWRFVVKSWRFIGLVCTWIGWVTFGHVLCLRKWKKVRF